MSCQLYQLAPQTHTQMMGYVLQTNDALIVLDGGNAGDAPFLRELLHRLGGAQPHITAWFLTHPHHDHVGAFVALMEGPDAPVVEQVYHCFPSRQLLEKGEPGALTIYDAFERLRPRLQETILAENMTLQIGETHWKVLYVSEPNLYHNASNNSSCVLKLTVAGVDVLFLGDLGREGGEILLRGHRGELPSQVVQMAHHGQSAVAMDVYEAIRPQMCLWCTPDWLWRCDQGHRGYDSGYWDILLVRRTMNALGVRRHVVAKDGTACITLQDGTVQVSCYDPFAAQ